MSLLASLKIADNFRLITSQKYIWNRLSANLRGVEGLDFQPAGDGIVSLIYFLITFGNNPI
jgi:hypothetical protein